MDKFNSIVDKGLNAIKPVAKWGMVGSLLAAALFTLLVTAGNLGGGFMPVICGLFILLIMVSVWACVPVFVLIKKEDVAKKSFVLVLAYWYITSLIAFFNDGMWARDGVDGLLIAFGVFSFFLALTFLGAIVVYVIGTITKKAFLEKLGFFIFAGSSLFLLICFALAAATNATIFNSTWTTYFADIRMYLILPVGIFFGAIYFFPTKANEVNAAEPTEAPAEDAVPEEEPQAEEEAAATEAPKDEE